MRRKRLASRHVRQWPERFDSRILVRIESLYGTCFDLLASACSNRDSNTVGCRGQSLYKQRHARTCESAREAETRLNALPKREEGQVDAGRLHFPRPLALHDRDPDRKSNSDIGQRANNRALQHSQSGDAAR